MRTHVVTTGRVWSRGAFMLVLGYFMCVNVKSTESSGGDYKGILTYYYLEWEFLTEQKFYSELSIFKAQKKSSIKWMKPGRNERKISEWIFCINLRLKWLPSWLSGPTPHLSLLGYFVVILFLHYKPFKLDKNRQKLPSSLNLDKLADIPVVWADRRNMDLL